MTGIGTVLRLVATFGLVIVLSVATRAGVAAQGEATAVHQLTVLARICPSTAPPLSAETCLLAAQGAGLIVTDAAGGSVLGNHVTNENGAITLDVPSGATVLVTLDAPTSPPNTGAATNPIAVGPIGADTTAFFFLVPTGAPSPSPNPSPLPSAAPSPPPAPTTANVFVTRSFCSTGGAAFTEFVPGGASPGGCSASAGATLTLLSQDGEAQDAQATAGDGSLVFPSVPVGTYTILDDLTGASHGFALTAGGASFAVIRYVTAAASPSPNPSAAPSPSTAPSPSSSAAPSAGPSAAASAAPSAAPSASASANPSAGNAPPVVTRLPSTGAGASVLDQGSLPALIAGVLGLVGLTCAVGARRRRIQDG